MSQKSRFSIPQDVIDLAVKFGVHIDRVGYSGGALYANISGDIRKAADGMDSAGFQSVKIGTLPQGNEVIFFANPLLFTVDVPAYAAWYKEQVKPSENVIQPDEQFWIEYTEDGAEQLVGIRNYDIATRLSRRFLIPVMK